MNWAIRGEVESVADIDSLPLIPTADITLSDEAQKQFDAAKELTQKIINDGLVGDGPWGISLSGYGSTDPNETGNAVAINVYHL